MQFKKTIASASLACTVIAMLSAPAHAEEFENQIKVGYAHVNFNLKSGDLTGPPMTTPPGIGMDVKNLHIAAISYQRNLSPNWGIQFQGGIPPTLTAFGTRAAQSAGTVAKARIWFPTLMAVYTFTDVPVIRPYIGVGATYTFFTEERTSPAYTASVGGTSSTMTMKPSWSPYLRIGFEYPIDQRWSINTEFSTYHLKTTATISTQTPGFGEITRRIDAKDNPRIFGLTVGYKF